MLVLPALPECLNDDTSSVYEKIFSDMDSLVIDCQVFYKSDNPREVFFKEIAAFEIQAGEMYHFLLRNPERTDPSSSDSEENLRLAQEQHGINWNRGNIPYDDAMHLFIKLCKPFRFIYAVGSMMKSLLENILHRVVYDLSELSIPPMTTLMGYYLSRNYSVKCPYHIDEVTYLEREHRYFPSCSFRNAFLFGLWMFLIGKSADLSTTEGRLATFRGRMHNVDNKIVDGGFCMAVNCETGWKELYCTHCGFIESDVEEMSYILENHKVCSLLCHLKNYEPTCDLPDQFDCLVL